MWKLSYLKCQKETRNDLEVYVSKNTPFFRYLRNGLKNFDFLRENHKSYHSKVSNSSFILSFSKWTQFGLISKLKFRNLFHFRKIREIEVFYVIVFVLIFAPRFGKSVKKLVEMSWDNNKCKLKSSTVSESSFKGLFLDPAWIFLLAAKFALLETLPLLDFRGLKRPFWAIDRPGNLALADLALGILRIFSMSSHDEHF